MVKNIEKITKTDFVGIGAPKAATTWIGKCLNKHPEVTRGEFNVRYLYNKKDRIRIKNLYPKAKIIVCLRNPVERAISMYFYRKSKGIRKDRKTYKSFEEQIKKEPYEYLEYGNYYKYIKSYIEDFGREKILILIYEDIEKDPVKFIKNIYNFLEIDENFIPSIISVKINTTDENRLNIKWLYFFLIKVKRFIEKIPSSKLVFNILKKTGLYTLGRKILKLSSKRKKRPKPAKKEINIKTKKYLKEYFSEDIIKLENLIQKDLTHWK